MTYAEQMKEKRIILNEITNLIIKYLEIESPWNTFTIDMVFSIREALRIKYSFKDETKIPGMYKKFFDTLGQLVES